MITWRGGVPFAHCVVLDASAKGSRETYPYAPPAAATLADVPQTFLQGPSEVIDVMKELRVLARRQTEDTGRIAECVLVIGDETKT